MGIISQYWMKWLCIFKGTYGDTHRVTLTWMAFTKIDHFILQILLFVVNEDINFSLHDGEIWKHLLRRKYVN